MKVYGKTAVSEFLGDSVVYRKLVPFDERLPSLDEIRDQLGLPEGRLPRKTEPEYAQVIVQLLRAARALELPDAAIERLVYVGDTRLNDGTAFSNLCEAGKWPGIAFIGSETAERAEVKLAGVGAPSPDVSWENEPVLFLANRWTALDDFDHYCIDHGFPIDARTAVIVDLDKTALGARGRNAHVIDQARVLAVQHTVADLLGGAFDEDAFQIAYDHLNQPDFHPFTADNQDYLAYICLALGSGMYGLDQIISDVRTGRLTTFAQFIWQVNERASEMTPELRAIHAEIYANVRAGDPTPFKAFRYNEYQTTVARMGQMGGNVTAQELIANEIVITQEVRAQALEWRARGALLFGLSDKPDEASVPSSALAAQGLRAIHQTETHAVGG